MLQETCTQPTTTLQVTFPISAVFIAGIQTKSTALEEWSSNHGREFIVSYFFSLNCNFFSWFSDLFNSAS